MPISSKTFYVINLGIQKGIIYYVSFITLYNI